MWVLLAVVSALCLGFYDVFKKLSVTGNNVLTVLFLNTLFGAILLSPVIINGIIAGDYGFGGSLSRHLLILIKSGIVLASWILGYFSIKHLPLTITGPVNATRPILVLVGAMIIFGERLNLMQWGGIALGGVSLFLVSRIGKKEGHPIMHDKWLLMSIGAMILGAISGLYDKWLLKSLDPLQVQSWYSLYQCIIMGLAILLLKRKADNTTPFKWKWTIPCIAVFLTAADLAYFYALSLDGSMISIVSMIRRGSVIVSFLFGAVVLHEKNVKLKLIDLSVLLAGLILLVLGSR